MKRIPPAQREQARYLRRNMTDAEKLLWERLRDRQLGVRFRRQHPIGPHIVDFATFSGRIAIEVDGPTHGDWDKEAIRDADLVRRGWRVLRFRNADVYGDTNQVVSLIRRVVEKRTASAPHPGGQLE